MSTTKNRKKLLTAGLGAAAAAVVAPAMLFAGTGTAQAGSIDSYPGLLGVTVTVNSHGESGDCDYDAVPIRGFGIPTHRDFQLGAFRSKILQFPGIQLGTTWHVTVTCPNGSFTHTGIY